MEEIEPFLSKKMVSEDNLKPTTAPEADLGYGELFSILIRRYLWLLGVLSVSVAMSAILTIMEKPKYQSSMQLLVEPNLPSSQEQANLANPSPKKSATEEDYATQINLMRSRQFIQEAVSLLQSEYPNLKVEELDAAFKLSQVLEEDTQTQIFKAVYVSDDAKKTQKVLETLQQVYQKYNLQQQELRLNRGLAAIDKQLQESRENLVNAQGSLEAFLGENGLVNPEQQAVSALESLTQIQQDQKSTQLEYSQTRAQYLALQQQLSLSPQVALITARLSQSSRYQFLLNELQKTDVELATRRVTYTDTSPVVRTLLTRRQSQLRLLQEEVYRIAGSDSNRNSLEANQLLSDGQLSPTDIKLVDQLVELQSNLSGLAARNQSLATVEQQLQNQLNRFPALIAEYERLQPQVESERTNLQQLLQLRQELTARLAQGGFNWQIVEAPKLGEQISPQPRKNVMLGVVVGLFLGGAAAFLREATDDTIYVPDALQKQTGFPLIGTLPNLLTNSRSLLPRFYKSKSLAFPPIETEVCALLREEFDLCYKNIQIFGLSSSFNSLVVTSSISQEGKSTVAIGLALSAARLHQKVLLIDANFRSPDLHNYLHTANEKGLSTVLIEESTNFYPFSISLLDLEIDFIPSGPLPEDPIRLLSSPAMKDLILNYESQYDLVILDAPPAIGTVDTLQIASICKNTLLVSRPHLITKSDLQKAATAFNRLNVIGILANQC